MLRCHAGVFFLVVLCGSPDLMLSGCVSLLCDSYYVKKCYIALQVCGSHSALRGSCDSMRSIRLTLPCSGHFRMLSVTVKVRASALFCYIVVCIWSQYCFDNCGSTLWIQDLLIFMIPVDSKPPNHLCVSILFSVLPRLGRVFPNPKSSQML